MEALIIKETLLISIIYTKKDLTKELVNRDIYLP